MNDQNQPGYQHNPNIQPYTTGAQPNNGHNPYEFIMQANAKPPKAGPSFAVRLMVVVGGIFLLFVGIAVALSLINGGQDDTERFTAVAKEQQQIVLLATTVTQNAKSDSAKAFALNTQLSLQTSLAQTQDFMKKNEMKLDDKALSQTSNKDATDALASAKESQDYDTQARKILNDALMTYAINLKKTATEVQDDSAKQVLRQAFSVAGGLVEQNKVDSE